MRSMDLYLQPLHHDLTYTDACIELLNSHWPRSKYSRSISLQKSCDSFPVSLVMLDKNNVSEIRKIYGYARICLVPGRRQDCWVESVIVPKEERGRGLGRHLMKLCEEFALNKGFTTVFLSTHDKREFYERVGYHICSPVCTMGANSKLLEGAQFAKFRDSFAETFAASKPQVIYIEKPNHSARTIGEKSTPCAPPPPPIPPMMSNSAVVVHFMKKCIA